MKISIFWVLFLMLFSLRISAQQSAVNGRLVDAITDVPLPQVKIAIEGSFLETFSGSEGEFSLETTSFANTEVIIVFSKTGYLTKRFPLKITSENKNLETIILQPDPFTERQQQATISLSDAEILSEEGEFDNISGILQSTRDVFLNAAAFDFSQTFFRVRGLGSEYGKLLINGMEMNKAYDGRPQWSNWGGLNDVQRNQVFTSGIAPGDYNFGGLGGTTNIIMRASKYQSGGRISLAGSNRTYTGRAMATYSSGEKNNGWFYSFSIGRRYAEEGYIEGTLYDSNSFFASVEKKVSEKHSINFSGIYTPVNRGRFAPVTEEVLNLKGRIYNPYWGFQQGDIRNSRMKKIEEPILMLNHFWEMSKKVELNTNLSYQFGEIASSRIDYGGTTLYNFSGQNAFLGGGANPDPVYYQKLPGYFLRFAGDENFEAAYRAREDISENGQFDWQQLYLANKTNFETGKNAIYALTEDVNQDNQIAVNTILNWNLKDNFKINSSLNYSRLESRNFARIADLFGGNSFLDIDIFAEEDTDNSSFQSAQSNLLNQNRLVTEGDNYKYDYDISSEDFELFSQVRYNFKRLELGISGKLGLVTYQRTGNYQNGIYPENSLGESDGLDFTEFGIKTAGVYKFSGRHNIEANLGYFSKAPGFRNTFVNPRQNNEIVQDVDTELISTGDLSYRFRSSKFNLRLSGYFTQIKDATEVSYYFANGLSNLGRDNASAFVQEVLTDVDKRYLGLEFGSEYQITSTLKLKAAMSVAEFNFSNNPQLYLSSAAFEFDHDYGKTFLKNYRLAGGPQRAAQLGFEYRDPAYWWFGSTVNYFSHAFIDINPLTRTKNFQTDFDGLPLLGFDAEIAESLLRQEQFDDYFLVNAVGGKSWRLKDKYLGFFLSINNIFDVLYKSGGFEQARNSNYRTLKEDRDREIPIFGNKYWYGTGTSFFTNVYLRF